VDDELDGELDGGGPDSRSGDGGVGDAAELAELSELAELAELPWGRETPMLRST